MANIRGIELASEVYSLEDTSARNTATAASQTATQAGQTATQASQTATQASETASDAALNANLARDEIGDISALETTEKTDLVSAINEVKTEADSNETAIGNLNNLHTTAKTNLVSAINETLGKIIPQKKIWSQVEVAHVLLQASREWGTDSTKAIMTLYSSDGTISWIGEIQWLGRSAGNIKSINHNRKAGTNTITATNDMGSIATSAEVAYITLEYIGEHD